MGDERGVLPALIPAELSISVPISSTPVTSCRSGRSVNSVVAMFLDWGFVVLGFDV